MSKSRLCYPNGPQWGGDWGHPIRAQTLPLMLGLISHG